MKYRLKDRELQKRLDNISNGDFSRHLDSVENIDSLEGIRIYFGWPLNKSYFGYKFRASFLADELEQVPEYDPHEWNNYPEVEPPNGEFMRLEFDDGFLTGGTYDSHYEAWRDSKGLIFPEAFTVKRFRPWEE